MKTNLCQLCTSKLVLGYSSLSTPHSHDSDPNLPTTNNMAASNGKMKSPRKRVLVVGAGAAGLHSSYMSFM